MVTLYKEVKASERLPEECTEVFVLTGCGIMETGFYQDGQWYIGPNEKAVIVGPEFWLEPIEITEEEIADLIYSAWYSFQGKHTKEMAEMINDISEVAANNVLSKLK